MDEVKLDLDDDGKGAFTIMENGVQLGEMVVGVSGSTLTAYHTEVSPSANGKGIGKKLLNGMVEYARENKLQVRPLCSFVNAQFKRHPDEYSDVWKNN
jgi:predicted GNAT family acetyltransferase